MRALLPATRCPRPRRSRAPKAARPTVSPGCRLPVALGLRTARAGSTPTTCWRRGRRSARRARAGRPSSAAAASMMRALAWWATNRSRSLDADARAVERGARRLHHPGDGVAVDLAALHAQRRARRRRRRAGRAWVPSARSTKPAPQPRSWSLAATTTAPAPSPKSTAVPRSSWSVSATAPRRRRPARSARGRSRPARRRGRGRRGSPRRRR